MGDRGNIAVLQSNKHQVWLYSHWGGYELPENIKTGLIRASDKMEDGEPKKYPQSRWNDESYLTKILFCTAIGKENFESLAGHGISATMQDSGYPINVVDIPRNRVFTMPKAALVDGQVPERYEPEPGSVWSFQEYVDRVPAPENDEG